MPALDRDAIFHQRTEQTVAQHLATAGPRKSQSQF